MIEGIARLSHELGEHQAINDRPERCPNAPIILAVAMGWGPLCNPTPDPR
jgi:hypothetical protein